MEAYDKVTLQLFDYQAQGADLMASRQRFGLHDEMGIGKTPTSIGAIDRIGGERGIIVVPAMLRENWLNEIRRFSTTERRVCKGRNIHDFVAWSRGRFDILVTSYELMTKWMPAFHQHGEFLDFLIFDEAHFLKNSESQRTRALLGKDAGGDDSLTQWAEHAWHVSGTPMANDPMDVYTFLRFTRAMDLNPNDFQKHFFDTRLSTYGARNTMKADALRDMQQLIYNNSIRRTHQDVGMYLPQIWLKEVLIEGHTLDLEKAMAAYPHLEQAIIEAIETGNLDAMSADYIAVVRRLVGKAKAVAYAELLKLELDSGAGKRVVFCWHTEPLLHVKKYLERHGYGAVAVYGSTPEHERIEAVRRFQSDPDCKVFIGNIRVAGTGLTLTASCEIDMLESDWSPAGNAQAIKRVHRYGQTNEVHARFITLAKSIDVQVNKTVARKTASIAQIEGHAMTAAPLDVLS